MDKKDYKIDDLQQKLTELKCIKQKIHNSGTRKKQKKTLSKSRNTLKSFYSNSSVASSRPNISSVSSNLSRTFAHLQQSNEKKYSKKKQVPSNKFFKSNENQAKLMPLKNLKKLIMQISESKIKYNDFWVKTKLPIETMEQYLYTFLNQKYGLKPLVIDWVSAIVNSIQAYSKPR